MNQFLDVSNLFAAPLLSVVITYVNWSLASKLVGNSVSELVKLYLIT